MILTQDQLHSLGLKNAEKTVVLASGSFDLFHTGHLNYLNQCKGLGDILVVCVLSDKRIRKVKGSKRPYIGEKDRAEIVNSIKSVDYVFIGTDYDPDYKNSDTLPGNGLSPDTYVFGHDSPWYKAKMEPDIMAKFVWIPPKAGISTSMIEAELQSKGKI